PPAPPRSPFRRWRTAPRPRCPRSRPGCRLPLCCRCRPRRPPARTAPWPRRPPPCVASDAPFVSRLEHRERTHREGRGYARSAGADVVDPLTTVGELTGGHHLRRVDDVVVGLDLPSDLFQPVGGLRQPIGQFRLVNVLSLSAHPFGGGLEQLPDRGDRLLPGLLVF